MSFYSSKDLYAWLCSFLNLEKGGAPGAAEHFKLDRMKLLAELSGHPEAAAPVIHIAGTKGKGTVTAMIAGILRAAGKKTGSYFSPHVSDWRERICCNGGFFSEDIYCRGGSELYGVYRDFCGAGKKSLGAPTFFELLTLLFFLCARSGRCDVMAVETGLGGRLDATNIVDPLVSVITVIEKEHTEYLGATLAEIAAEKGGIVKPGRPLVLAKQPGELEGLFEKIAGDRGSPFLYLPRRIKITAVTARRNGTDFTLCMKDPPGPPRNKPPPGGEGSFPKMRLFVPIPGSVHASNAALAALAAVSAFPGVGEKALREGLGAASLPARFEARNAGTGGPFIVDGAHTPQSAALCAETFCKLYGAGGILLFGCAKGKDPDGMAEVLRPRFSEVIITSPGTFRESDPQAVYDAFCRAAGTGAAGTEAAGGPGAFRPSVSLVPDTKSALEKTVRAAKEKKLPVLACGSFYLAGEVMRYSARG